MRGPKYTAKEELFIRLNYGKITCDEIGLQLNRTGDAIQHKAGYMGLLLKGRWSTADLDYIREHYNTTSMDQMARVLKRNAKAITAKANRMEITRSRYHVNNYGSGNSYNVKKPISVAKAKPAIMVSKIKPINPRRAAMEKQIATIPLRLEDKLSVRIDRRTVIWISKDKTPDQVQHIIDQYKKKAIA